MGTDLIFVRCRHWEKFQNSVGQGTGGEKKTKKEKDAKSLSNAKKDASEKTSRPLLTQESTVEGTILSAGRVPYASVHNHCLGHPPNTRE